MDHYEKLKVFLNKAKDFEQIQNEIESGLVYMSGNQYNMKESDNTEEDLQLSRNELGKYRDWVVNHIRQFPFHIDVETIEDGELWDAIADSLQEDIDDAVNSPSGREASECAFNTMVSVGYGYETLGLDYKSNRAKEQSVCPYAVKLPQMVYIDLDDDSIDGSEATQALVVRFMDKDSADEMTEGKNSIKNARAWNMSAFKNWDYRQGQVPDVTYSYIKEERETVFYDAFGNRVEAEVEGGYKRNNAKRKVIIVRFIGDCLYEESELDIPYLPVVAFRGDTFYRDDLQGLKYTYAGYYQRAYDLQQILNYLLVSAVDLASTASKSPFVAAEGQTEDYPEWEDFNRVRRLVLKYKPKALGGEMLPPPQRMDNSAQVEWILNYAMATEKQLQSSLGINDAMIGEMGSAVESGRSRALRQSSGSLTISAFLDNFQKSIQHKARVTVAMAIEAKPNRILKVGEEEIQVNLKEVGINCDDFMYVPTQGPANESKRMQSFQSLVEIFKMVPQKAEKALDLIIDEMDIPNSHEIKERFKKIIEAENPGLIDDDKQEDPRAVAIMNEMQATIAQLEEAMSVKEQEAQANIAQLQWVITQLQLEVQNKQKEIEARLLQETMKQEAETARNTQDNMTDLAVEQIKAGNKVETESIKEIGQTERKVLDLTNTPPPTVPEGVIPSLNTGVRGGTDFLKQD